jgi:hypothetical protein
MSAWRVAEGAEVVQGNHGTMAWVQGALAFVGGGRTVAVVSFPEDETQRALGEGGGVGGGVRLLGRGTIVLGLGTKTIPGGVMGAPPVGWPCTIVHDHARLPPPHRAPQRRESHNRLSRAHHDLGCGRCLPRVAGFLRAH